MIETADAKVIAVAPERLAKVKPTIFNIGLDATILADTTNQIMHDCQVYFKITQKYQDMIRKNLKADIADSRNATINWREFDLNYKNRASPTCRKTNVIKMYK